MQKKNIAHLNDIYLPITETWIYNQVANLKRFKPIFIAHKIMNMESFPLSDVYSLPSPLYLFANNIHLRLFGTHIPFYHKSLIKSHNVVLLHAHFGPEGVRNIKLKSDLNLPMITTFYGYDVSTLPKYNYWKKRYRKLFEIGDLFLTEGNHMKTKLVELGCPEKKIIVHHIGVDTESFKFKIRDVGEDGQIRILMAATLKEKKGISYGIKAFSNIKRRHDNAYLTIIGDGELRNEIECLIEKLNLTASVKLMGYQPHTIFLDELYKSHIFLSPSITAANGDSEGGAPVAIIEAQATGVPVVSSYHADIPEIVVDGKSALLAPEKDVDRLTEHLEYLISNPECWSAMGIIGRKHVETEHNINIQNSKLEDIYDSCIRSYSSFQV